MIHINCHICPLLISLPYRLSGRDKESTRIHLVCGHSLNTLQVINEDDVKLKKPTKIDVKYSRIEPDANCREIFRGRATGEIMWPDFSIYPDGSWMSFRSQFSF